MNVYYVYVLKSEINDRLYTGSTANLNARLKQHNEGKSKYTKSNRPFRLVYKENYNTRAEAVRREKFLKTGKGREFLKEKLGD